MHSHQLPSSIAVSSANEPPPAGPKHHDGRPRMFIGPIPEKVISQTEAIIKKHQPKRGLFPSNSHGSEDGDDIFEIIKQNAFSFFIRQGGRPEDWGEDEERNVVEEMVRRWRGSEWAKMWRSRRDKKADTTATHQTKHWVGGSFEIGRFLGVNLLVHDHESSREGACTASGSAQRVPLSATRVLTDGPGTSTSISDQETFASASTGLNPSNENSEHGDSRYASSSTSLLRSQHERINGTKARTDPLPRPALALARPTTVQSDGVLTEEQKGKGKGRLVHYADSPLEDQTAPPVDVLERSGLESLQDTSAGAAVDSTTLAYPSTSSIDRGDVIMRDRMLVRTCYSKSDNFNSHFDEQIHRTTQNLLDADWAEYLVAWRKDQIELYTDYVWEHLFLKKADTDVPNAEPPGQGMLGSKLPETIEVRNPRVNTRVKIDIPPGDSDRLSTVFSRENLIALCKSTLASVPDWKNLIEREMEEGKTLELAWRRDTNIDWVWLDHDVNGHERRWAVLCGLALKQSSRPPCLEIRLADHYPTYIHLKNGNRLQEPPAIEGYVERIRPNSQLRQSLYLSTHDGNLFVMTPNHAFPPSPPGLAKNIGDVKIFAESLRKSEVHRGAMQVMHAIGVNDLRSILVIRRASRPMPESMHRERSNVDDSDIWASIWAQSEERTAVDEGDEGGEAGLDKAEDKIHLRMRRSFELLLNTGHVVRFEAHSCHDATEWIERLRALVLYWKQRHRMDAKEEMDLAQSRRPRLTPLTRLVQDEEFPPDAPPDMGAPMPALGSLYSWCILEGCKSIVKGGKLFVRKGLWGQYKLVQLFLSAGHLTRFRIKPKSSLHQTMHKKISLADAYVCSGYLAAMALPKGQYRADAGADPRRYQDGLETNDPEEEMMFMIWYHPQRPKLEHFTEAESPVSSKKKAIPQLSDVRKLLVCRTRSRLERDAWCWALNCEIERLVREQKEQEAKIRDTGNLIPS
ncbi:hypothetical protein C0991_006398 [Blastosporella zonata]|nr:hypothetical protein C0991_006398 [Blastosporella zonata]